MHSILKVACVLLALAPSLAVYPMLKEDGAWRINGCRLARLPGRET